MAAIENRASSLFCDLMIFFNKTQKEVFGWDGAPLHDPVTIASLLHPELLVTKPMYTEIDIRGVQSYGRTNCDYFNVTGKEPNSNVAIDIDVELFWDIIEEAIRNYN